MVAGLLYSTSSFAGSCDPNAPIVIKGVGIKHEIKLIDSRSAFADNERRFLFSRQEGQYSNCEVASRKMTVVGKYGFIHCGTKIDVYRSETPDKPGTFVLLNTSKPLNVAESFVVAHEPTITARVVLPKTNDKARSAEANFPPTIEINEGDKPVALQFENDKPGAVNVTRTGKYIFWDYDETARSQGMSADGNVVDIAKIKKSVVCAEAPTAQGSVAPGPSHSSAPSH